MKPENTDRMKAAAPQMFEALVEVRGLARMFKFSTAKIDRAIARALSGPVDDNDELWDESNPVSGPEDGEVTVPKS